VLQMRPKAVTSRTLTRPRAGRRSFACQTRRGATRDLMRPEHRKGRAPGRRNPREPGSAKSGEHPARRSQPAEGQPLKRDRSERPWLAAPATALNASDNRSGKVNRTRGGGRREACAISVRSSSEGREPRERAWLKRYQGGYRGSKAPRRMVSVRAQQDPGTAKAREWWLSIAR